MSLKIVLTKQQIIVAANVRIIDAIRYNFNIINR